MRSWILIRPKNKIISTSFYLSHLKTVKLSEVLSLLSGKAAVIQTKWIRQAKKEVPLHRPFEGLPLHDAVPSIEGTASGVKVKPGFSSHSDPGFSFQHQNHTFISGETQVTKENGFSLLHMLKK